MGGSYRDGVTPRTTPGVDETGRLWIDCPRCVARRERDPFSHDPTCRSCMGQGVVPVERVDDVVITRSLVASGRAPHPPERWTYGDTAGPHVPHRAALPSPSVAGGPASLLGSPA